MSDKTEGAVSLNYQAEYERVCAKLAEATDLNNELHAELRAAHLELEWLKGFKAAVELTVGKVVR